MVGYFSDAEIIVILQESTDLRYLIARAQERDGRGLAVIADIWFPRWGNDRRFRVELAAGEYKVTIDGKEEDVRLLAVEKGNLTMLAHMDSLSVSDVDDLHTGEIQRAGGVYYKSGNFHILVALSGLEQFDDHLCAHYTATLIHIVHKRREYPTLPAHRKTLRKQ